MRFSIDCEYCPAPNTIMSFQPKYGQAQAAFDAAWKKVIPDYSSIECLVCGSQYQLKDDPGGSVQRSNKSKPKITSLNSLIGPREGGNVLVITGEALELGDLVVKFDGNPAPTVDQRTVTTARVVVPQGCYRLNVLEHLHALTLTITSGSLALNEAVTTDGGSVGVIRRIDGSTYNVIFQTIRETPTEMVGTSLIGGGTGGTASIDTASLPSFADGEQALGLSTSAIGVARGGTLLTVDNPTTSYASDELVKGESSGAMVKLGGSPAYSGLVDVTVENENGQRVTGGTIDGAYTYA